MEREKEMELATDSRGCRKDKGRENVKEKARQTDRVMEEMDKTETSKHYAGCFSQTQ